MDAEPLWVATDAARHALESGDFRELHDAGVPFSVSSDRVYLVLAREHSAWHVPGEGWRSANAPPRPSEHGRFMLNFFKVKRAPKPGLWFKVFVPAREGKVALVSGGGRHVIVRGEVSSLRVDFERVDSLMWQALTGHAAPESEIERTYSLIGGA